MDRLDLNLNFDLYKENIINFLKENNCLESFNKNSLNCDKSLETLYNNDTYFYDIICDAFIWAKTPQGYTYWSTIHNKLQSYKLDINILKNVWYD